MMKGSLEDVPHETGNLLCLLAGYPTFCFFGFSSHDRPCSSFIIFRFSFLLKDVPSLVRMGSFAVAPPGDAFFLPPDGAQDVKAQQS